MMPWLRLALGLGPVLFFALVLYFLDNYRLLRFLAVLESMSSGVLAAGICWLINIWLNKKLHVDLADIRLFVAPAVEEIAKALYIFILLKRKQIGFVVDGAILAFAAGAGFAVLENISYLTALSPGSLHIGVWVIRGFGTAVMHGSATAIVAIVAKNLSDRRGVDRFSYFMPGLLIAILLHASYNRFMLVSHMNPLLIVALVIVVFPLMITLSFARSEQSLRDWLEVGFSSDSELLEMIRTGTVLQSKLGQYLQSLKVRLPNTVLADMLCYLRIYIELSIKAKTVLLLQEQGFSIPPEPEMREKFAELKYLEKSIGKIGKRILAPFLHTSTRELWQLHMLKGKTVEKARNQA